MSAALLEYPNLMLEEATELTIRTYPNPCLSEVASPISEDEFGSQIESMGNRMIALAAKDGLGLAATQVGLLKRMFVMQFPNTTHDPMAPLIICNPVIELSETGAARREGCLSLPGVQEQVWRADEVFMRYQTPYGEAKSMVLVDMEARIVQHEVDHLDGLMFTSRMSRQMRRAVLAKYEKISRKR
jgi:peptide deformylase